jgi:hypothetical protein
MLTKLEVTVLQHGLEPLGVKVWNNRCWTFGDERLGRPIRGATADTTDKLVGLGLLRTKEGWGTKYETTEIGSFLIVGPKMVRTVGDLAQLLASLPQDMLLFQRGNIGNWTQNVKIGARKLAKHRNDAENYHADMTDPVWQKVKATFHPEFLAVTVS